MSKGNSRSDVKKDTQPKKQGKDWLPVDILFRSNKISTGQICCSKTDLKDCGELRSEKPLTLNEKYELRLISGSKRTWEILVSKVLNTVNFRYSVDVISIK